MKSTLGLREMLNGTSSIQAVGVGDAGQARLGEAVGFPAIYVSGSYVNHTRGYPDGTLTMSEIAQRVGEICDRVSVPVIADGDEGFGGTLKIARTVHEFERAGASAIQLEDFVTKKHGLPISIEKMCTNIRVMLDERSSPDFITIARTDAMAPWRDGLAADLKGCEQEAFERLLAYCDAGVDVIFANNASNDWIREYGPKLPKPIMVLGGAPKAWPGKGNVSPREEEMTATEMLQYNVKLVIYATNMLSRSHKFMTDQYASWLKNERFDFCPQDEIDRADANKMIGLPEKMRLLDKYGD